MKHLSIKQDYKTVFTLFVFGVDFVLKLKDNFCMLFIELILKTKPYTGKEKTRLFLFIKCVKKNERKKLADELAVNFQIRKN